MATVTATGNAPDSSLDRVRFNDFLTASSASTDDGSGFHAAAKPNLDDFKTNLQNLKNDLLAALFVTVEANTTDRACHAAGASGLPQDDGTDAKVTLLGSTPGSGTTLPAGGAAAGGAPAGDGSGGSGAPAGRPPEGDATAPKGSELVKRGGSDLIVEMTPFLELERDGDGKVGQLTADKDSCCTFGEKPEILISSPTEFATNVSADFGKIVVVASIEAKLTPIRASGKRKGLCWQGICGSPETLSGVVFCSIFVKFSVRATGAIKFGPITIGKAGVAFMQSATVPVNMKYSLKCTHP